MKKQKTVTYDLADIARKLFAPPSANKLFVYNVAARGDCRAAVGDEDFPAEYFGGRLEGIF